jgi:hypothetical protein
MATQHNTTQQIKLELNYLNSLKSQYHTIQYNIEQGIDTEINKSWLWQTIEAINNTTYKLQVLGVKGCDL